MVVYAEYVFLENFIMNFIILSLTAKFGKHPTKKTKLLIASSISALYAFIIFFPSLHFLFSIIMKIACSMIIIVLAFTPYKFKDFFRLLGVFYLITLVFGGAGFAIFYFSSFNGIISNGIFYISNISIKNIFIACGVGYILINFCWGYFQKQFSREKIIMKIKIEIDGITTEVRGIVDTGNSLVDPISHYPVIIVEYDAIAPLLPSEVQRVFNCSGKPNFTQMALVLNGSNWITRFRMIPYNALGTENGMLLGFKPDQVYIQKETDVKNIKEIIVAIYDRKLSKAGEYRALLHPDLI
ncbi:stage II sporulation protein GA (sporulation sigma-E factor processing peptidase) [Anaerovirgula multivorans]|uniref:Sporulation sigma-E factor-processing peptidase n=1 Tax=Anaerovirgula multivorans TaxID=312168 RepID=A0A239CVR2_9FIRM|nr:sigma-E processing peptidase SpoIIGA [Anaerovirgula multivorans]SNS24336.1 stage II sporulation protein GA (sporulation sigma-E factor processing peptidase) [Anaerovirgula multivorans]